MSSQPSETSSTFSLYLEMEMSVKWDNKTSSSPSQSLRTLPGLSPTQVEKLLDGL